MDIDELEWVLEELTPLPYQLSIPHTVTIFESMDPGQDIEPADVGSCTVFEALGRLGNGQVRCVA